MSKLNLKRDYLTWFLDTQRLKWPSTAKVLEYITKNEHILERIELVDDIRYYRNALMISGRGTSTFPFVLRLEGQYIHDVDDALQFLSKANCYKLYVKLSFSREFYLQKPEKTKHILKLKKASKERNEVKYLKLMSQIDAALDQRDQTEFYRLSTELKQLRNV